MSLFFFTKELLWTAYDCAFSINCFMGNSEFSAYQINGGILLDDFFDLCSDVFETNKIFFTDFGVNLWI